MVYSMLRSDKRSQNGPPVTVFGFLLISLLYNGEICPCLPFFDLNQIGHNSVNFEATASRFCMEEDLEEEEEVEEVDVEEVDDDDDNDDNDNHDDDDNDHGDDDDHDKNDDD